MTYMIGESTHSRSRTASTVGLVVLFSLVGAVAYSAISSGMAQTSPPPLASASVACAGSIPRIPDVGEPCNGPEHLNCSTGLLCKNVPGLNWNETSWGLCSRS